MAKKKVKSLDEILTESTGLNADERQQWRDDIAKLMKEGKRKEAANCFTSFSYWQRHFKK